MATLPVRFQTPPASWADLSKGYTNPIMTLARALAKVVRAAFPDATETVQGATRMGYVFFWWDDKNDVAAMISPEEEMVKLYIHHLTKDPNGALKVEGTGKNARHVKFRLGDKVDRAAVRALLGAVRKARDASR